MRALRIVLLFVVAGSLVAAALVWLTAPSPAAGQLLLGSKTPFSRGSYYAYVSPWGGESYAPTKLWSRVADGMVVDLKRFPSNSRIAWRWPPSPPPNDAGVWGYDWLGYGNYDGGEPETPIAPIQVKALKALRQTFRWTLNTRFGDADVLTEFYLHPTPKDPARKAIEIGWFLHAPPNIRRFFEGERLIGTYVDDRGRRWTVRMGGKYCMFAPERAGDVASGSIDMLHALAWLRAQHVISGDEWFLGLAIGIEPVAGLGQFKLDAWQVQAN